MLQGNHEDPRDVDISVVPGDARGFYVSGLGSMCLGSLGSPGTLSPGTPGTTEINPHNCAAWGDTKCDPRVHIDVTSLRSLGMIPGISTILWSLGSGNPGDYRETLHDFDPW